MSPTRRSAGSTLRQPGRSLLVAGALLLAAAMHSGSNAQNARRQVDQEILQPGTACTITGHRVRGPGGEDYGHVVDLLIGTDARPSAVLIRLSGFMGVGEVTVAIPWSHVRFTPAAGMDAPVTVDLPPDQIRKLPPYRPGMAIGAAAERPC